MDPAELIMLIHFVLVVINDVLVAFSEIRCAHPRAQLHLLHAPGETFVLWHEGVEEAVQDEHVFYSKIIVAGHLFFLYISSINKMANGHIGNSPSAN